MCDLTVRQYTPDERDSILEVWGKEQDAYVIGGVSLPPCPHWTTCNCQETKQVMGFGNHVCLSDSDPKCIVLARLPQV